MSSSLNALLTQLSWQKSEVLSQISIIDTECSRLIQYIDTLDKQLTTDIPRSKIINPELEISRLNFTLQLQEEKAQLAEQLKTQEEQKERLQQRIQRIKTELKMLDRYLKSKQQQACQEQSKSEEQSLEEWVLQNRESA